MAFCCGVEKMTEEKKDEKKVRAARARSKSMTQEERSAIAKKAAESRWSSSVVEATHGSPDRPMKLGDIEVPCYVLSDKRRVIVQAGAIAALGMAKGGSSHRGGTRLAKFVGQDRIKPFATEELLAGTSSPVKFRTPSGAIALGFEATIIADICSAVISARIALRLTDKQIHIAERCEMLMKSFAKVGIIALVDEATGYQEDRDREALQQLMNKYLRREFAVWASHFPEGFYREIYRLRNWTWNGMKINRPQCVAGYTKDFVYSRLAPGILQELESRNPVDEKGRRAAKHYYWLTEDIGHPALAQHLHAIIGLMKAADDWTQFKRMVDRSFPKRGNSLQMELFNPDD